MRLPNIFNLQPDVTMRATTALLTAAAALTGCAVDKLGDDSLEYGVDESYALSTNALSTNALSTNALSTNALSTNALSTNALSTNGILNNWGGSDVVAKIVGCALPYGTSVTATDSAGTPYTFYGALGLAPSWATSAPSTTQKKWVSACILARVNAFGLTVNVSLRGNNSQLLTSAQEDIDYPVLEGAVYGNLFTTPAVKRVCSSASWEFSGTEALDGMRLCMHDTTYCGFVWDGECTAKKVCSDNVDAFGSCKGYAEVVTVHTATL